MANKLLNVVNLLRRATALSGKYENVVLLEFNDHVVRLSLMTGPYFWHLHPDSDELFIGIQGSVLLEIDEEQFELHRGDMYTVPKGRRHRTSPVGHRSVNLTIERSTISTIRVEGPAGSESMSERNQFRE